MKLDAYLTENSISEQRFADLIGVSQQAVHRYRTGRVPTSEVMQAIITATDGKVTADDFFELPDTQAPPQPAAKDAVA